MASDHDGSSFQCKKRQPVAASAGDSAGRERGEDARPVSGTAPSGQSSALVIFSAHRQVDEGEDVKLNHDGEAQEDGIEDQHIDPQLPVQSPFVEMDAQDLAGERARVGSGQRDTYKRPVYWETTHKPEPGTFPHSAGWSRGVLPGTGLL